MAVGYLLLVPYGMTQESGLDISFWLLNSVILRINQLGRMQDEAGINVSFSYFYSPRSSGKPA